PGTGRCPPACQIAAPVAGRGGGATACVRRQLRRGRSQPASLPPSLGVTSSAGGITAGCCRLVLAFRAGPDQPVPHNPPRGSKTIKATRDDRRVPPALRPRVPAAGVVGRACRPPAPG